ncbi:RNase H, partial [Trametes versicolor FP-101664 SS1]|uniref:RNase H n=1 Tax=Trametes versicolor (strain FP-101664) TaxID=717944 RepID=UPI000462189B
MIKAAKKYGVRCDSANPSIALRKQMPLWYHIGREASRVSENTESSRCLREAHRVRTVQQGEQAAARLSARDNAHVARASCECGDCDRDRSLYGCDNPHRCAATAAKILNRVGEKWKLVREENRDGLTLTPGRRRENDSARLSHDRVLFDPTLSTNAPLAEVFRVFVPPTAKDTRTALRLPRPFQLTAEAVEVFTDGSAQGGDRGTAVAGSGVWFGEGDVRNSGERVPHDAQTNQIAEIHAVTMAHRLTPPFAPLHVVSD